MISSKGILYVTYGDRGGPYQCEDGAVYKYDTNTGIWTDITPPSGSNWDGSPKYENWYGFAGLSVDAQNPDTLIVHLFSHGGRITLFTVQQMPVKHGMQYGSMGIHGHQEI